MKMTNIAESCELHARIGWQGLTKKEYLDEGDYYLVTGVDFDHGHMAFDNCHYVTKDRYDQNQHIQLKLNDVLVTKDGTIGKVAIIDEQIDKPATQLVSSLWHAIRSSVNNATAPDLQALYSFSQVEKVGAPSYNDALF